MINTLRSEHLKLVSIRGTWIAVSIFAALSLLVGLLNAAFAGGPFDNAQALGGIGGLGIIVLAVMAASFITGEYRTGTINPTFQITPQRLRPMVSKGLVIAAWGALLSLVTGVVAIVGSQLLVKDQFNDGLGVASAGAPLFATVVVSAATALGALGLGALTRNSVVATSLIIAWMAILEGMLTIIPHIGDKLAPFLPFLNAQRAVLGEFPRVAFHWGRWESLAYFVVVSVVIFALGAARVNRQDP